MASFPSDEGEQGPTSKAKRKCAVATEWSVTGEQTPGGPLFRPCFFSPTQIPTHNPRPGVAKVFVDLVKASLTQSSYAPQKEHGT